MSHIRVRQYALPGWGAAICDPLAPQDGDIVIEGKRGLDTFASTNLDFKHDFPMFSTPMSSRDVLGKFA